MLKNSRFVVLYHCVCFFLQQQHYHYKLIDHTLLQLVFFAEFLGFNNKTCSAGVPPKSPEYGNTVGPQLRGTNDQSHLWRYWDVKVLNKSSNGEFSATLKNAFPKGTGKPRCLGYYLTDYYHYRGKAACTEEPWASRVHLHKESRPWRLVPVAGTDCYNIVDNSKPKDCLNYLSASSTCSSTYLKLAAGDDGSGLQRWRLSTLAPSPKPSPPSSSPKPKPSPPFSPSQQSKNPLLLSVGASTPWSGSIVFQPSVGAASCSVIISNTNATMTTKITLLSYPQTAYYPSNLVPDSDYSVKVECSFPGSSTLSTISKTLHTPPTTAHPGIVNFVPTSTTSGTLTVNGPGGGCQPTSYVATATPNTGGPSRNITSTKASIALPNLTPGVTYTITVVALCADGSFSQQSEPVYLTPPTASAT